MLKLNLVQKISLVQFLFFVLPLFLLNFNQESILSASMIVLYLIIDVHLSVLIKIAKLMKWSRIPLILTGFFGVKNIFALVWIILCWKANLLHSSLGVVFIVIFNYGCFSFALARKLLALPEA